MNRLDRGHAIVLLLQERQRTAGELAAAFEVSRRTILRDIQALCEIGVPIIAREGAGGGYSLPEGYVLAPLALGADEAFLLLFALKSLRYAPDLPFAGARTSLDAKLKALIPGQLPAAQSLAALIDLGAPDQPPGADGRWAGAAAATLPSLLTAAETGAWVRIRYQSAERQSTQHLLPRSLSLRDGFWYCLAYAAERGEERTYRVDRILELGAPEPDFAPAPPLPQAAYDDPSHPEIRVELTPRGAAYVETEPHLGPHIERAGEGGRLRFRCPPSELDWYARYFAGLGAEADVQAPAELRRLLRQVGADLAERYRE